ncbi:hypothetical protein NKH77_06520 [Streptomyces sp. M19]
MGLADADARRVMELLPRVGCVLADAGRWWWLVPSQSDIGIAWPPMARYEVGAFVPRPRRPGRSGPAGRGAADPLARRRPALHPPAAAVRGRLRRRRNRPGGDRTRDGRRRLEAEFRGRRCLRAAPRIGRDDRDGGAGEHRPGRA